MDDRTTLSLGCLSGPAAEKEARVRRRILATLSALALFLGAESLAPPAYQPSARLLRGAIDAYQAALSPLVGKAVRCKFEPSCSHYAEQAIERHGTLRGVGKTAGRLWRCSPWGPPPGRDLP